MAEWVQEHGFREAKGAGNYTFQRQLDFRLEKVNTLGIVSLWNQRAAPRDERDFQIALSRRSEREGASLADVGKKYGL